MKKGIQGVLHYYVNDLTIFCPSSEKLDAIEGHLAK
jgi:hypothetical protein